MNKIARDINLFVVRNVQGSSTRTVLFLVTLGLFILSAGAPDATGGFH